MNPLLPFEDAACDVLGKAIRGLEIAPAELAEKANVPDSAVKAQLDGQYDESVLLAAAPVLGLNGPALADLATGRTSPEEFHHPLLRVLSSHWEDMIVNSYLVVSPNGGRAILFDTGTDADLILNTLASEKLTLDHIFITHTHIDHVAVLGPLLEATENPPAHANAKEKPAQATGFDPGKIFEWEGLTIETKLTWGHAEAGTTFVVTGSAPQIAVVGDAIFARSMGGGKVSYEAALQTNREEILTLLPDTLIAPGHGPLTTVAVEKATNPFFA